MLNAIDNPEQDGTFSVTWSAVADATSYLLEEDDDPDFGSPSTLLDGNYTRWPMKGPMEGHIAGTFYYGVKVMQPMRAVLRIDRAPSCAANRSTKAWHPDGTLLKRPDHPEVMLLENGKRRPFANESIYFSHYPDWKPVGIAQSVEYDRYEVGEPMTFRSGTIIKEPTLSAVYAIDGSAKRTSVRPAPT